LPIKSRRKAEKKKEGRRTHQRDHRISLNTHVILLNIERSGGHEGGGRGGRKRKERE